MYFLETQIIYLWLSLWSQNIQRDLMNFQADNYEKNTSICNDNGTSENMTHRQKNYYFWEIPSLFSGKKLLWETEKTCYYYLSFVVEKINFFSCYSVESKAA